MSSAKRLADIIDKMTPLQDQKKLNREALIQHMIETKKNEVTANGVTFTLKSMSRKPTLSLKFLNKIIEEYNNSSDDQIDATDLLNFIKEKRSEESKQMVTLTHKVLS